MGAIALVLAAVIVLPMVFDSEPKPPSPPVSVRIPGEEDGGFSPKVTPKVPPPAEPARPAPAAAPTPAPVPAPAPPKAEAKAPAEKPPSPGPKEQFVVQVGAFLDPAGVLEKLNAARIPHYGEPIATAKGRVTRVRAGPFPSREAAEMAQQQLRKLGLKPGSVIAKP